MECKKHAVNGIVSLVISVVATAIFSSSDDGSYTLSDVLLAVGVSAFLSGLFTSYFASE
jgi:hypothetical protein